VTLRIQVHDSKTGEAEKTDKPYGRALKAAQLPEGIGKFFPIASPPSTTLGLPADLLLPIIKAIKEDIEDIRDSYAPLEIRMVGGSLLIVYEGDITRAKECIAWMENTDAQGDEEDEDEDEDESKPKKPWFPHAVKLIDFAHTVMTPGQGPDEGVLKGFDTVVRLLEGRIKEIEEAVAAK
jgi:inositol-polyphosphate multikinase